MAQPLFANQRETNLSSAVALVEEVLRELGHDPSAARQDAAHHTWRIRTGSAATRVSVFPTGELSHIRVEAVVITLDDKVDRPSLFAHLLFQNVTLCGVAFALHGERVVLVTERSTLDLDRSEVRELISRVTQTADDHDDRLIAAFGGVLGEHA
jgi:site-specific recombinase